MLKVNSLSKRRIKLFFFFLLVIFSFYKCGQNEQYSKEAVSSTADFAVKDGVEEIIMMSKTVPDSKKENNSKTWKKSDKTINTASLFVGDNEQIPLKGSQQMITIDGFRARVLIDCFYYNDRGNNLEGTFKMKLPQGAKPYYFAFGESIYIDKSKQKNGIPFLNYKEVDISTKDIEKMRSETWSKPKVAKVVEKEKAAFAYGEVVRRQVDPALAEWAGADIFNCKVFPLTENKLHRIVIGYDVNLTSLNDDLVFNLPIANTGTPLIIDFNIANISGTTSQISPQQNIEVKNKRKVFRLTNPKEQEISIRYKSLKNIGLQSIKNDESKPYFSSYITPVFPKSSNSKINDNAIFALDVSLSSNPVKFNIWLKMIKAILSNNSETIKNFNVLLFNIEASWWEPSNVKNSPKNIKKFLDYANQISLEGATDIGLALSEIAHHKNLKNSADNIFLLSDGADTWGESGNFEISKNIDKNDILFAFNTGLSGTSLNKLNHLTNVSGGAIFSISGEDEIEKASTAFKSKPWKINAIKTPNTKDIIIQGNPQYIYPGQKLLIAGRGVLNKNTKIQLSLSQNNLKKDLFVSINKILTSKLTSRVYGQIATDLLENYGYATEKESIAYAKHFNIPGKTCSLLMLESEEDYEQYNIKATENAFVVNATSVNNIITNVMNNINNMIGNSKVKFKKWLTKLSKTDGLEFETPASLELVINKIPESSFSIKQMNLNSKSKLKKDTPEGIRKSISKSRLDYDSVTNEALRRKDNYSSDDALKVLSSLTERNPGDAILSRDVAYYALSWGLNEQAYYLFKRVINNRPYEPQTYLAIAQSLAKIKNYELSLVYYEIAITAKWNDRFGEFRKIAALDYLNLLGKLKKDNNFILKDYVNARHRTLRNEFSEEYADLIVTISWNTDNTDIDLHVKEPTGEDCFYSNRKTKIGGTMTEDVTQGYGPEMYLIKDAKKGKYNVKAKYYSSNRNRTSTRTKIFATIYKNWGKKNESVVSKTVTLEDNKEMHEILTLNIK